MKKITSFTNKSKYDVSKATIEEGIQFKSSVPKINPANYTDAEVEMFKKNYGGAAKSATPLPKGYVKSLTGIFEKLDKIGLELPETTNNQVEKKIIEKSLQETKNKIEKKSNKPNENGDDRVELEYGNKAFEEDAITKRDFKATLKENEKTGNPLQETNNSEIQTESNLKQKEENPLDKKEVYINEKELLKKAFESENKAERTEEINEQSDSKIANNEKKLLIKNNNQNTEMMNVNEKQTIAESNKEADLNGRITEEVKRTSSEIQELLVDLNEDANEGETADVDGKQNNREENQEAAEMENDYVNYEFAETNVKDLEELDAIERKLEKLVDLCENCYYIEDYYILSDKLLDLCGRTDRVITKDPSLVDKKRGVLKLIQKLQNGLDKTFEKFK